MGMVIRRHVKEDFVDMEFRAHPYRGLLGLVLVRWSLAAAGETNQGHSKVFWLRIRCAGERRRSGGIISQVDTHTHSVCIV